MTTGRIVRVNVLPKDKLDDRVRWATASNLRQGERVLLQCIDYRMVRVASGRRTTRLKRVGSTARGVVTLIGTTQRFIVVHDVSPWKKEGTSYEYTDLGPDPQFAITKSFWTGVKFAFIAGGQPVAFKIARGNEEKFAFAAAKLREIVAGFHKPVLTPSSGVAINGSSASRREPIPAGIRWTVLARDNFRCVYCGRAGGGNVILHVDHRLPVARGGTNDLSNLFTACQDCNLGKSTRLL